MTMRWRRPNARDTGSGDVLGLVLMAPVMLGFMMLIFYLGRQVDSHSQVRSAAAAAAEAAALQRSPDAAAQAATAAAVRALNDSTACAGGPTVAVDVSHFAPGGVVRVSLTCTAASADLAPLSPPSNPFTATAVATIDPFRAAAP